MFAFEPRQKMHSLCIASCFLCTKRHELLHESVWKVWVGVFFLNKVFVTPMDWNSFIHKVMLLISVQTCFHVWVFEVLVCFALYGPHNKADSANRNKSCVFLTQFYGNISAFPVKWKRFSRSVAFTQWHILSYFTSLLNFKVRVCHTRSEG